VSKQRQFVLTSQAVAIAAGTTQQYVTLLASQGLVPHVRASNGLRLFPETAGAIVRQIKAENLKRRGIKRPLAVATA